MMERRPKGAGQVLKTEGRSWAIRWMDGGRKRYLGGFATEQEAKSALEVVNAQRKMRRVLSAADEEPGRADGDWAWAARRWLKLNPRERQAVVFARDGGRCAYCGREVTIWTGRPMAGEDRSARAVMDHRVPLTAAGSDALANIVLACEGCNAAKGGGAPPSFRATRQAR